MTGAPDGCVTNLRLCCLEQGADLHMAKLMPLPLTFSCFSKIQIGFTFLVPADLGSPGKGPLNGCVCWGGCKTFLHPSVRPVCCGAGRWNVLRVWQARVRDGEDDRRRGGLPQVVLPLLLLPQSAQVTSPALPAGSVHLEYQ